MIRAIQWAATTLEDSRLSRAISSLRRVTHLKSYKLSFLREALLQVNLTHHSTNRGQLVVKAEAYAQDAGLNIFTVESDAGMKRKVGNYLYQ
jgi:hypothetical protein